MSLTCYRRAGVADNIFLGCYLLFWLVFVGRAAAWIMIGAAVLTTGLMLIGINPTIAIIATVFIMIWIVPGMAWVRKIPPTGYSLAAAEALIWPWHARKVWREKVKCEPREVLFWLRAPDDPEIQFWDWVQERKKELPEDSYIEIFLGNDQVDLLAMIKGRRRILLVLHWQNRPPRRGRGKRKWARKPKLAGVPARVGFTT
jgi:hypothetical protein